MDDEARQAAKLQIFADYGRDLASDLADHVHDMGAERSEYTVTVDGFTYQVIVSRIDGLGNGPCTST